MTQVAARSVGEGIRCHLATKLTKNSFVFSAAAWRDG